MPTMPEQSEKVAEFIRLTEPGERLREACRWVQHCYRQGHTVAVHVADRSECEQLDVLLWTFKDRAFIPHKIAAEAEEPVIEPVLLYCAGEKPGEADALVEAGGGEPADYAARYGQVYDFAEVYDEDLREQGRRRFAALREAGYRMRFIE